MDFGAERRRGDQMYRINEGAIRLAGAYETDTIKTSIMAFQCRHRPEQHKSGGFPPTPPVFSFFRLRRAVMAIVDEADEDDDDDDEDDEFRISAR